MVSSTPLFAANGIKEDLLSESDQGGKTQTSQQGLSLWEATTLSMLSEFL